MIHDTAKIMHLDLRLDNFVITDEGVGFVDFGSSVRVGERLADNPLLASLFDELMRTSQIQRMIEKMTLSGAVTSHLIQSAYGRVDKQVDLFYLAMQMTNPLANPDFKGLVEMDADSREAAALSALKEEVLKPRDPTRPTYGSAGDVLRAARRAAQVAPQRLEQRRLILRWNECPLGAVAHPLDGALVGAVPAGVRGTQHEHV